MTIKNLLMAAAGVSKSFFTPIGSSGNWNSVSCSSDGAVVHCCTTVNSDAVYESTDYGASFASVSSTFLSGGGQVYSKVGTNAAGTGFSATFKKDGKHQFLVKAGGTQQVDSSNTVNKGYFVLGMCLTEGFFHRLSATTATASNFTLTTAGVKTDNSALSNVVTANYGGISRDDSHTYIVIANNNAGYIRYSSDGGASYVDLSAYKGWISCKVSDNGQVVVGVAGGDGVYVSTNAGSTFTKKTSGSLSFSKLAISANGSVIVAVKYGTQTIYLSKDTGATWVEIPLPTTGSEADICLTADGALGYVAMYGGYIHKFNT